MRFFFVNTAIRRLITILHYTTLHYITLHYITKTISTLFRDISETFPSQCRSHLVRISFACRSHYGV